MFILNNVKGKKLWTDNGFKMYINNHQLNSEEINKIFKIKELTSMNRFNI